MGGQLVSRGDGRLKTTFCFVAPSPFHIFALTKKHSKPMDNIQQIAARYRTQAEEAGQELNRVQQRIYRIGTLRVVLFVACVAGLIYFWNESWSVLCAIAVVTMLPFLLLIKRHNRLFARKDYLEKKVEVNQI